jgi:hypothetical protein
MAEAIAPCCPVRPSSCSSQHVLLLAGYPQGAEARSAAPRSLLPPLSDALSKEGQMPSQILLPSSQSTCELLRISITGIQPRGRRGSLSATFMRLRRSSMDVALRLRGRTFPGLQEVRRQVTYGHDEPPSPTSGLGCALVLKVPFGLGYSDSPESVDVDSRFSEHRLGVFAAVCRSLLSLG